MMSLKELCESVGVSRRSIQGYEKAGLMKPTARNKYGYLMYDETTMQRAKLIKFLHDLGFQLNEISSILDAPKDAVKEAVQNRIDVLYSEIDRLNVLIDEALEYVDSLE